MMSNASPKQGLRSLRSELMLMLSIIITLVSILFNLGLYIYLLSETRKQEQLKAQEYEAYLQQALDWPMWNMDYELASKISSTFFANPEVNKLILSNEDGTFFFENEKDKLKQLDMLEFAIFHDDYVVGKVELGLSLTYLDERNKQVIAISILSTFVFILTLLAVLRKALTYLLKKPVDSMMTVADKIVEDDYQHEHVSITHKEFSPILDRLMDMATVVKKREHSLKTSEQRLKLATNASDIGIWDWDLINDELLWDDSMFKLYGVSRSEFDSTYEGWVKRIHPDDRDSQKSLLTLALNNNQKYETEFRIIHDDGNIKNVKLESETYYDSTGKAIRLLGVTYDITETKRTEEQLRVAATAFEAQEGIMITDSDYLILRVNYAFTKLTGFNSEALLGKKPDMFKPQQHDEDFFSQVTNNIDETGQWNGEIWVRHHQKNDFLALVNVTAVTNNSQLTHYVFMLTDITEKKVAEEKILELAFYDPLTKLPNRRLLLDRLEHSISVSARNNQYSAVLFIDLDNFKTLNDTKGHDYGDIFLVEIAERLKSCAREGDSVARLGGDEFIIVLHEIANDSNMAIKNTETVCNKIRQVINQPCVIKGYTHQSSASIGVSFFYNDNVLVSELLKQADTAMYSAKSAGRNSTRIYDPVMQDSLEESITMEKCIRDALTHEYFELYFQKQVDESGHVVGAEALIRLKHPELGMISPATFIPLAEEKGFIISIGTWVLETACKELRKWENDSRLNQIRLSINVSPRQFQQAHFVDHVKQAIKELNQSDIKLRLEITESLVHSDIEETIAKMNELKKEGITFALDDFGTGYSSLSYLTQLPIDIMKIDQAFVRNMDKKHSDAVIVQTMIGMANNLKIPVIAEGVETVEQFELLKQQGCHLFQGYYFGKPVSLDVFKKSL